MLYFLDTSALLKRYHLEEGSNIVINLFESEENELLISGLSLVEIISVLNKRRNRGAISNEDFEVTRFKLALDHNIRRVGIIGIQGTHLTHAIDLIIKYNLSANDAIILACALDLQEQSPIFVCADVRSGLLHAAEACRISTLNPLSP